MLEEQEVIIGIPGCSMHINDGNCSCISSLTWYNKIVYEMLRNDAASLPE
jgi:hypothetical protein